MARVSILDPVAPYPTPGRALAPRLASVAGKTVGFRIDWWNFADFTDRIRELLEQRHGIAGAITLNEVGEKYGIADIFKTRGRSGRIGRAGREEPIGRALDDFAGQVDWAVVGLAG